MCDWNGYITEGEVDALTDERGRAVRERAQALNENDRLREALKLKGEALRTAQDAVGRLREDWHAAMDGLDKAEDERDRLRRLLDNVLDEVWARFGVRLRALEGSE